MTDKLNKFAEALSSRSSVGTTTDSLVESPPPAVSRHTRPSRSGTKHIGGYFDPAVSRQIRAIALEEDSTVQQLLGEALDLLFHHRQKPMIASNTEGV